MASLAPGRTATEEDLLPPPEVVPFPSVSEQTALAFVERGVKAAIVRLPPSVHGDGDHGFVPILVGMAREKGVSAYIDTGLNRWPGVHRLDAPVVYRLALEHCIAGARYHALAEDGVPFMDTAGVIGRRLKIPVMSKTADEAKIHFSWFTAFAGMDVPAFSKRTQELLGWQPKHRGLLANIDDEHYFKPSA